MSSSGVAQPMILTYPGIKLILNFGQWLSPVSLSHMCAPARTTQPRIALSRTPAENHADKPSSVSTSTSSLAVNVAPVPSRIIAAAAVPATTPSLTAPALDRLPATANSPPHPANEAKNKVEQLQQHQKPLVSTPLDLHKLALELASQPDRSFVNNLVNALRYGTRIGYLGPQKNLVSRNLISASQHPEVITANLNKEIQLGRVAGPFSSSPLPNFQCHPIGVVPKKHSTDWRTIYHLSYPKGDSINDYIPKDPYSLQYVRVDDAINIVRSLGPGAFMAKTDLNQPFASCPSTPVIGTYWVYTGKHSITSTFTSRSGSGAHLSCSTKFLMP